MQVGDQALHVCHDHASVHHESWCFLLERFASTLVVLMYLMVKWHAAPDV